MVLAFSCNAQTGSPAHSEAVRTTENEQSYTVLVDDNFHFMDEDERWTAGTYERLDEALHKCMEMVGQFMLEQDYHKTSAADLYDSYTSFGDDPFIVGSVPVDFSAWNYAEKLAGYLAGKTVTEGLLAERQFRIANLGDLMLQAKGARTE